MNAKFHERFNIEIGLEEAKRRFVNRALNLVFNSFVYRNKLPAPYARDYLNREIVSALGEQYISQRGAENYIGGDFNNTVHALEACYHALRGHLSIQKELDSLIKRLLKDAEVDLGIRWE